jgi:hypothetical protein
MLRRASMIALALGLLTAVASCGPKGLHKVEVPAAGVTMTYDLVPGATYSGHLRIGNTQAVDGGNISQALECDVKLTVVGEDKTRGGTLLRATFANIDLKWGLPPSAPISPEEFTRDAIARLQGMNVSFNVKPNGEIVYMPTPPQELSDIDKQFIDVVLRGLERAFLVVPGRAVKDNETWDEDEKRGREGKLGRYVVGKVETRVDGMYRDDDRKEDLVRLVISFKRNETITTEDGSRKNESEGKSTALFSTSGYLAEIEGESRDFDPVNGMTFSKIKVDWRKTASGGTGTAQPDVAQQEISDPCDPDYVGAETCPDGSETQQITDPCHPDYVGAETCATPAADAPAEAPPADAVIPK